MMIQLITSSYYSNSQENQSSIHFNYIYALTRPTLIITFSSN